MAENGMKLIHAPNFSCLVLSAVIAWILCLPFPGTGEEARLSPPLSAAAEFPTVIEDARGRQILIPARPSRIVSLSPSLTEMLFAIGVGGRVAGVTRWCDEPPEARSLPKVGDTVVDPEAVLSLAPDLVVTQADFNPRISGTLESLGIRVLVLEVSDIAGITRALRLLGRGAGEKSRSEALAAEIESRIEAVFSVTSGILVKPRIYVEIWGSPPMAAGAGSFMNEIVKVAGGTNLFSDSGREYFSVSLEDVVARDPQVALLLYPGATPEDFTARPCFSYTSAVRGGKIHIGDINLYVRPGPRVAEAVEDLARRLNPELFVPQEPRPGSFDGK